MLVIAAAILAFRARGDEHRLIAGDGAAFEAAGTAIAIGANVVVAGAPHTAVDAIAERGIAYVFGRSGNGWIERARLTAADGVAGDHFGAAVAVRGDVIAVGAPNAKRKGAVYIFVRAGNRWLQAQKLTASDANGFGAALAIASNTMIVGAPGSATAHVFEQRGLVWKETATLIHDEADDQFGASVAIGDGRAVVGAPVAAGAVYVFARGGSAWAEEQELMADDAEHFGQAVAIDGNTIAVGADLSEGGAGSAYVFARITQQWTKQARLTAVDRAAGDRFGYSIALHEDTLAVGSLLHRVGGNPEQGSIYLFLRGGDLWVPQLALTAENGGSADHFGASVAINEDAVAAGAPLHDNDTKPDQGLVYLFDVFACRAERRLIEGLQINADLPPLFVDADAHSCGAFIDDAALAISADACSGIVSVTPASVPAGNIFPPGTTPMTYDAIDSKGNITTLVRNVTVVDATPPVVTAPSSITVSADTAMCGKVLDDASLGAPIASDNCSVTVTRTGVPAGNVFPLGATTITYEATDGAGNTATASQVVTVAALAPAITVPANIIVNSDHGSCSAQVNPGNAMSTNQCVPLSIAAARSDGLPLDASYPTGITTITWTASDAGGQSLTARQTIEVRDSDPPSISAVSVDQQRLRPSNHKYDDVTIAYTAADNCSSVTVYLVVSSTDPVNGTADGDTDPDWVIEDAHHVQLRAERAGNGPGRTYTITVVAVDGSGNTASGSVTVRVSHSNGNH